MRTKLTGRINAESSENTESSRHGSPTTNDKAKLRFLSQKVIEYMMQLVLLMMPKTPNFFEHLKTFGLSEKRELRHVNHIKTVPAIMLTSLITL